MSPQHLRTTIRAKKVEAKAIIDAVEARGESAMWTDDEESRFDALKAEIASLTDRAERIESLGDLEPAPAPAVAAPPSPSVSPPDTEATTASVSVREKFLDDPMRGFPTPAAFMLSVMDKCRGVPIDAETNAKLMSLRPSGVVFGDPRGGRER